MAWRIERREGNDRVITHLPGGLDAFKDGVLTAIDSHGCSKVYANDPAVLEIQYVDDPPEGFWFRNIRRIGEFAKGR